MTRKLGDYCLKCFAELPSGEEECRACGFRTRPSDLHTFWSKHPRHVRAQRWLQRSILLATVGYCALTLFGVIRFPGLDSSLGQRGTSFMLLVPLGFAVALWEQAGHLTRHPRFNWTLVWAIVVLGLVAFSLYLGSWPATAGFVFLGAAAWFVRRRFLLWKSARIQDRRRSGSVSRVG